MLNPQITASPDGSLLPLLAWCESLTGSGGIAAAALLGILVLREPFNLQSLAGFILSATGILVIAMR